MRLLSVGVGSELFAEVVDHVLLISVRELSADALGVLSNVTISMFLEDTD